MGSFSHVVMLHPPILTSVAAKPVATVAIPPAQSSVAQNRLIYFRSPALGGLFLFLPRPRSSFALPVLISPTATPSDQTLFDEPQTGGQQHYLPAYGLATTKMGNLPAQFAVSLATSGSGHLLTVKLNNVTDLNVVSNRKAELPATLYLLSATLPGRAESWSFPNATLDGASITLTMPISDPGVMDAIYSAMTDRSQQTKLILRRSPSLALPVPLAAQTPGQPPPQQLYRQSSVAIDSSLDFYFDRNIDQNVFATLPSALGGKPSTLNHTAFSYAPDGAKSYSYWQDPAQQGNIYFLPNSYQIARLSTSPHTPAINISTNGSDPATLSVTLTFLALPVWDAGRISAAVAGPLLSAFNIPAVNNISILSANNTQLLLNLPSSDPSGSNPMVPIENATIDTAAGIKGSVTLGLAQFQQVYNAIYVTPSTLLSGEVTVTVDADAGPERVPFSGTAADFYGPILDTSLNYNPSTSQVTVVATNAIESPIHIGALTAVLRDNSGVIPTTVVSVSPSIPADLKPAQPASLTPSTAMPDSGTSVATASIAPPGSSMTLVLQLASNHPFDSSSTVQFDMSQITVIPDSRAIWEAIVQNQVVAPVKQPIKVYLPASVFSPQTPASTTTASPAAGSTAQSATSSNLLAVQVVFQNGQTATFQPSTTSVGLLTQDIGLNVAIESYVLGQGDSSSYTYRVDTITAGGVQHGTWKTTNQNELFVTLGS